MDTPLLYVADPFSAIWECISKHQRRQGAQQDEEKWILDTLKNLSIKSLHSESMCSLMTTFIPKLSLPNLHLLHLSGSLPTLPVLPIGCLSHLSTTTPSLRTLKLTKCWIEGREIGDLVRVLPNTLSEVEFCGCELPGGVTGGVGEMIGAFVMGLSHLNSITFRDCKFRTVRATVYSEDIGRIRLGVTSRLLKKVIVVDCEGLCTDFGSHYARYPSLEVLEMDGVEERVDGVGLWEFLGRFEVLREVVFRMRKNEETDTDSAPMDWEPTHDREERPTFPKSLTSLTLHNASIDLIRPILSTNPTLKALNLTIPLFEPVDIPPFDLPNLQTLTLTTPHPLPILHSLTLTSTHLHTLEIHVPPILSNPTHHITFTPETISTLSTTCPNLKSLKTENVLLENEAVSTFPYLPWHTHLSTLHIQTQTLPTLDPVLNIAVSSLINTYRHLRTLDLQIQTLAPRPISTEMISPAAEPSSWRGSDTTVPLQTQFCARYVSVIRERAPWIESCEVRVARPVKEFLGRWVRGRLARRA